MSVSPVYASSSNQVAALKELYTDNKDYLKDLVYKENPFMALVPKNEDPDGFAGKYIPVPIEFGVPQGRSHTFATAQNNQTAVQLGSFFVYVIEDYQLVTITNLLMEQTKNNAGAFVDEAKLSMDGGFRNQTNNIAFELFGSGTATRGIINASGVVSLGGGVYQITLSNPQSIVNFEVGMTLQAAITDGGAPIFTGSAATPDLGSVSAVNRISGSFNFTIGQGAPQTNWAATYYLTVQGDIGTAGGTGPGPIGSTGSYLALSGLAAWVPLTAPASSDSFWGVNRSQDTRLGGLRYDASAFTIEEGMTNALALANREGAHPDMAIMDFESYASLCNSLGAKVQYVEVKHDEVDVAFEGVRFHSSYGYITVLADRSCPPSTAYVLTMNTWKLRSLGKVPHILTYGMEGLEGLRVGNADALEIRIGYYGNLICSAPGWNMVVTLSS